MFNAVAGRRKSRVWSPRTIAISVGAHLLLLAGFVTAAESTPAAAAPADSVSFWFPPKPPPPPPTRPKPVTIEPSRPAARTGTTLVIPTPTTVPTLIPLAHTDGPAVRPQDVTGIGTPGDVIGPPSHDSTAATGDTHGDGLPLGVETAESVDVLPALLNQREAQRSLERAYPPMLRDAGVTGHTTVSLIIDADGKVRPGSVTVEESTEDAFRDAAVQAVAHFRFRPAQVHGQAVGVFISLPIEWKIGG